MDPANLNKIERTVINTRTRYVEFWKNRKRHAELIKKARENSVAKHGARETLKRKRIAGGLYKFRALDRAGVWGRSFNAGLKELSTYWYNLDLVSEIMERAITSDGDYHVLEVGCGGGKAASELYANLKGKVRVSALGLARIPEWAGYPNCKKIGWHVGDVAKLSRMKAFPAGSVDFIHSNIGIGHSPEIYKSLQQVHKVLKRGGRIIFTYDGNEEIKIPNGFKFVKGFPRGYKKNPLYAQLKTYYFEKV